MRVKRPHICGSLVDCRPEILMYPPAIQERWPGQPAYPCRISFLMPDILRSRINLHERAPLPCNTNPVTSR